MSFLTKEEEHVVKEASSESPSEELAKVSACVHVRMYVHTYVNMYNMYWYVFVHDYTLRTCWCMYASSSI